MELLNAPDAVFIATTIAMLGIAVFIIARKIDMGIADIIEMFLYNQRSFTYGIRQEHKRLADALNRVPRKRRDAARRIVSKVHQPSSTYSTYKCR